ncbi:hypothetical protein C0214_13825 [Methylobacterium sp. DM1]|nr:hypothetical protein C0214_13825 [Methylobacterium sp. DM1]
MICPKCSADTKVVNSRPHREDASVIQRRRACVECGHRFNSFESTYDIAGKRAADRARRATVMAGISAEEHDRHNERRRMQRYAREEAAKILKGWTAISPSQRSPA